VLTKADPAASLVPEETCLVPAMVQQQLLYLSSNDFPPDFLVPDQLPVLIDQAKAAGVLQEQIVALTA